MIPFIKNKHFLDRLPKRKRAEFERRVRDLIEEAFRTAADRNMEGAHWRAYVIGDGTLSLSPHNPDWCHAFGLVQGVALSLGLDMWNSSTEGTPRHWFDNLTREISEKWYTKVKTMTDRGEFDPTCTCGRKMTISVKCPVCDNDE